MEQARKKQAAINSETSVPLTPLKAYDHDGDKFTQRRYRGFLINVVLPFALIVLAGWYFLVGQYQKPVSAATPSPVPTPFSLVNQAVIGGGPVGSVIGGGPVGSNPVRYEATLVPVSSVRCYAVIDSTPVYTGSVVLQNGLFLAERYTRASGGLLYNARFGWHKSNDFGCDTAKLSDIEVEFLPIATMVASQKVVSTKAVIVKTPTPVVVPTVIPSPTLVAGLSHFKVSGCEVSWLAWNVNAVWLTVAGKREGVAGDNGGLPVVRSVCPYVGPVKVDVLLKTGETVSASGVITVSASMR